MLHLSTFRRRSAIIGVIYQLNRVGALSSLPLSLLYKRCPIRDRMKMQIGCPHETYNLIRRWKDDKVRNAVYVLQLLRISKIVTSLYASFEKSIPQILPNRPVTLEKPNMLNLQINLSQLQTLVNPSILHLSSTETCCSALLESSTLTRRLILPIY